MVFSLPVEIRFFALMYTGENRNDMPSESNIFVNDLTQDYETLNADDSENLRPKRPTNLPIASNNDSFEIDKDESLDNGRYLCDAKDLIVFLSLF